MRSTSLALLVASAVSISEAQANPALELASAFDEGDRFDLHTSLLYRFRTRTSAIKREDAGFPGTGADDPMPIVKDLVFHGSRHELVPRLELGLFQDLWVSAELPLVLHDSRRLEFDQRATPCVFPNQGGNPTCINADNSTTIADGILPREGFDALDPTGPGFTSPGDATIFRGPKRVGLDQLHLGIGWAPMNQRRDASKPTWKLGVQLRTPIGKTQRFDRSRPNVDDGVSRGVTELRLSTSIAKRVSWAEPYFDVYWQAPLSVRKGAPLADVEPRFGSVSTSPQQTAGTTFGVEAVVWEKPAEGLRVALDVSATLEAFFEGRDYSDMWEVFAFAGDANTTGAPLILDSDPRTTEIDARSHPGVTNVENYMALTSQAGVTAHAGERVRFGAHLGFYFEQSHLISFADAGKDLPMCQSGQSSGCEPDGDDVVDPNSAESNPLYAPVIDVVGHRYRASEARAFQVLVDARVLF